MGLAFAYTCASDPQAQIRQDIYRMRNECQALSDARLYVDGELVRTGLDASGKVVVVPERPKVKLPPSSMPPKWPKH